MKKEFINYLELIKMDNSIKEILQKNETPLQKITALLVYQYLGGGGVQHLRIKYSEKMFGNNKTVLINIANREFFIIVGTSQYLEIDGIEKTELNELDYKVINLLRQHSINQI